MARTDEQVFISVEGTRIELADGRLISASVEQSLVVPDAFNIVLMGGLEWLRDDTFAIGKEVKLEMAQGNTRRILLVGEATGLITTMTADNQVHLHVRGYDRSHRLQRGHRSRSFIQMSDSNIARQIASEVGLSADVTPTSGSNDYLYQHNQTNLDFLQARAARIGYQVGVRDRTLYFKPIGEPTGGGSAAETVRLEWGETLIEAEVSQTSSGQPTQVTVRGWDPDRKEEVIGQAQRSQAGPETQRPRTGAQVVSSAFSDDAPMVYVDAAVRDQGAAERMAQAVLDELQGAFTTAEGTAIGNPSITPGASVQISGAGILDGTYKISEATHLFDRRGYHTTFRVTGSRSLSDLPAAAEPSKPAARPALASLAIGVVSNIEDPLGQGRVKVKLPVQGDNIESDWCRVTSPTAGGGRGMFFLPEVRDEVLVAAIDSSPIVLGALWNGSEKPPRAASEAVKGGKVVQRVITSRSGHEILFDDEEGKEKVVIKDKSGNSIVFECKDNKLTIKSAGDIEIDSSKNITIKASQDVNIKGSKINLN